MTENSAIIVVVLGGMVQDVRFPEGCRTAVSIHDYDVGRSERGLHRDGEGDLFSEANWEPSEAPEPDSSTGRAEIDRLPDAEVRKSLIQLIGAAAETDDTAYTALVAHFPQEREARLLALVGRYVRAEDLL